MGESQRTPEWLLNQPVSTTDADKFYQYLSEAMASHGFASAMNEMQRHVWGASTLHDVAIFRSSIGQPSSILLAHRFAVGIMVEAINPDGTMPTPREHEAWRNAAIEAHERLDQEADYFNWWALIATDDSLLADSAAYSGTISFSGLTVHSLPYAILAESAGNETKMFYGGQQRSRYAMLAMGSSPGHDGRSALGSAATDLNNVCALFNIELGGSWEIIHSPQPRGDEYDPDLDRHYVREMETPVNPLPDSLPERFDQLTGVDFHHRLALSFHQALSMESRFPSVALSQYVAGIESLGSSYVKLERCDECGSQKGSAKRFQAAASIIHGEEGGRELKKRMYGIRSKVAHEGKFFGGEEYSGSFRPMSFYGDSPTDKFLYDDLRVTRNTLRELLRKALASGLPGTLE